jgi:Ca2+-binding EF-hand superfamily protein
MKWCSILILALVASTSRAQDDKTPDKKTLPSKLEKLFLLEPDAFLKALDANMDGFLQKSELPDFLAKGFALADKNGDGKLDREETAQLLRIVRDFFGLTRPAAAPAADDILANLLKRFDTNMDGKISRDEAKDERLAKLFDALDKNRDGFLDKSELRPLAEKIAAGKKDGGVPPRLPLDFDALDKNADGRLTPDEVKGTPLAAFFREIDTNGDGRIDRAELEAWLARKKE